MSGKIIRLEPRVVSTGQRRWSLSEYMSGCRKLTLRSIAPSNLPDILRFLSYQKADGELAQDIKALVIRRIACEALSLSNFDVQRSFDRLLDEFPSPIFMQEFMIPKTHALGEAQEIIETCHPAPGDTNVVLRGKREALLFNLTNLIYETYIVIADVLNAKFKKTEFTNLFSWIWNMLYEFTPSMPEELAELIQIHIFAPPLPFNIKLPD